MGTFFGRAHSFQMNIDVQEAIHLLRILHHSKEYDIFDFFEVRDQMRKDKRETKHAFIAPNKTWGTIRLKHFTMKLE